MTFACPPKHKRRRELIMNFYDFCKFVSEHQSILANAKLYPTSITLDSQIWDAIKNLAKFTSQFNFEHSISFLSVDKEIVATPPEKGTQTNVYTSHQIELKHIPKTSDYYERQILVNGKIARARQVKVQDIPEDPKIIPLFNIHSHPKNIVNGKECFSFFSSTDLNCLLSSTSLCMGLVTDQFFLACKSSSSPPYLSSEQQQVLDQINLEFYNKGELQIQMLERLNAVFYKAEFSKRLERIN